MMLGTLTAQYVAKEDTFNMCKNINGIVRNSLSEKEPAPMLCSAREA
jgi:hypothetical protein